MMFKRSFLGVVVLYCAAPVLHADVAKVTVAPGDTLWSIAKSTRPSRDVSIGAHAAAIFHSNPRAFSDDTMDSLLSGSELLIPQSDAAEVRIADSGGHSACGAHCERAEPAARAVSRSNASTTTVQVIRGSSMAPTLVRN